VAVAPELACRVGSIRAALVAGYSVVGRPAKLVKQGLAAVRAPHT